MARIDLSDFSMLQKERYQVQDEVPATYSVFESGGKKYFQIDTYGRNGASRKNNCHPTQILQFDSRTAQSLVELFKDNGLI